MAVLVAILINFLAFADRPKLVIVGDSLSEGYGVAPKEAYPYLLSQKFPTISIKPVTESGSTTASLAERVPWILAFKPTHVFVALGGNDGLRKFEPSTVESQLSKGVKMLVEKEVQVMIAGMKAPPNLGPEYTKNFHATFKKVADELRVEYLPFLLEGVAGVSEKNQGDGIHPNAAGHKEIAKRLEPVFKTFLGIKTLPKKSQP